MNRLGNRIRWLCGILAIVILLGALYLWGPGIFPGAPRSELPVNTILDLTPSLYRAITTTVNTANSAGDAAQLTWRMRHDTEGRLIETAGPGGVTTRIVYSTSSESDSGGTDKAGETCVFAHDAEGRLLSAAGGGGKVSFSYYSVGMPAVVRSEGAPAIRYVYDVQDRLAEMYVGETVIRYRYDYLSRLAAIVTPAGEITYGYQRASNTVVRRLPNGMQTFRDYNHEDKLVKISHVDSKNYIIAEYAYVYRPDGLIDKISERNQRSGERVFLYEYDRMQRLTAVNCEGGGPSHRYIYDALGNLVESITADVKALRFSSSPTGVLSSDSRGTCRADARGHIRQLPASPESIDYDFNGKGDLAGAKGRSIRYTYNALGLLTARSVAGRETRYLPDPFADAWQPIWRRDADGNETVLLWDGAVPLVELRGKEARYHLEDHLGSVRVEVDNSASIAAWHDYTPFGAPEDAEAKSDLCPMFAGLFWDPEAKVYLTKARAFDPVTARFLQPDPQVRPPGVSKHSHSLYAYCGGDPVNFIDRNGAEPEWADLFRFWNSFVETTKAVPDFAKEQLIDPWPTAWDKLGWDKLGDMLADEKPKRYATAADIKYIKATWDGYKTDYLKNNPLPTNYSQADFAEQNRAGNAYAWKEWRREHSGSPLNAGDHFDKIKNLLVTTNHGLTDLDWDTTIGNQVTYSPLLGKTFHEIKVKSTYFAGKTFWLFLREAHPRAMKPDRKEPFPESDQNALKLIKATARGDLSIHDIGLAPAATDYQELFKTGLGINYQPDRAVTTSPPIQNPSSHRSEAWRGTQLPGIGSAEKYKQNHPQQSYGTGDIGPQSKALANEIMLQMGRVQKIQRKYDISGGPGRVAGPGGFASPGAYAALADLRSSKLAAPSRVGGVYLGSAGKTLEGLGQLKGVAIDEATGKVVLIGSDDTRIALPPLRLADVVTVFRAVYIHGESPTVTIDPDEENPDGPIMHVMHGPGTEGTYVGWILFECDRIMKTLQLGKDNVNGRVVTSRIPGYAETLDAIFFGDSLHKGSAGSSSRQHWERFWIVPAAVNRFDVATTDLSLFDVPLKVNTQKMRWEGNKLVDDDKGESSAGAKAFTIWFAEHYDEIADENLLQPPPGSGLKAPVAVFHELRRIALITAIAERLRDMGESMPLWMRDYPPAFFPVTKTTPSLTIEKTKLDGSYERTSTIYGGVNLAPADKDVHVFSDAKGTKSLNVRREDAVFVGIAQREATSLTLKIPQLAQESKAEGKRRTITTPDGTALSAVVLPGADTCELASNRQQVVDLEVPIGLGRSISLTRHYNSFFDPVGECGKGWTLDLPELVENKIPVNRDGKHSVYRPVNHLLSPLGSVDIRFDRIDRVEPYGVEMAVAAGHPEIAGVASGPSAIVEAETRQVLFRDGTEWHFDSENGWLLLVQADGTATRYVRDTAGRLCRIVGYLGKDPVAEIQLAYDSQGRITQAKANQADALARQAPIAVSELAFEYGDNGRLAAVILPGSREGEASRPEWKYAYEADRLAQTTGLSGRQTSFGYNDRGQLAWEKEGDRKWEYTLSTTANGTVLTGKTGEESTLAGKWIYDACMRPVEADLGGGLKTIWRYGEDQEALESVMHDGKPIITRRLSSDRQTETTTLTDGLTYELRRDASGNPTSLTRNGCLAAEALWRADGQLGVLRAGATEVRPRRHDDGWPNGVLVSAPMKEGQTDQWLEEEWDLIGRPIKIKDSSGFEYRMEYDDQGRLLAHGRVNEDGKRVGIKLTYNTQGLVAGVESSWSKEKLYYGEEGLLTKVEVERQGVRSVTTFDAYGRPVSRLAFDGGSTTWRYDPDESGAALNAILLPNGERIDYQWSDPQKAGHSEIGIGPAAVSLQSDSDERVTTVTWGNRAP